MSAAKLLILFGLSLLVISCAKTKEERFNENFKDLSDEINNKSSEIEKQVRDNMAEKQQPESFSSQKPTSVQTRQTDKSNR